MPESLPILSRRALLKASPALAAAVVTPALATPFLPPALDMVLKEYAAASDAVKVSHARFTVARRQKDQALDDAALWLEWPGGGWQKIGESGAAMSPEYAARMLKTERDKCVAASDDADTAAEVRSAYNRASRRLKALKTRYDAIVAATDHPAADEADTAACHRFTAARAALQAYRPTTMPEVAAIIRCISEVGAYPGTNSGVSVRDLADMLDAGGVAI